MTDSQQSVSDSVSQSSSSWPSINSVHFSGMINHFVNQVHCLQACDQFQWIIDTGATDHVTSVFDLLYDVQTCDATLQLSNGETVFITHTGKLTLSSDIIQQNVLYNPTFTYNLLSISKLLQSTSGQVVFKHGKCYLQDTKKNRNMDLGNEMNGLYMLHTSGCNKCEDNINSLVDIFSLVAHVSNGNVWHTRMGHVPINILQLLPIKYANKSLDICDRWFFTKQSRLPFPHIKSTSTGLFHLVYVDLWGLINFELMIIAICS